VGLVSLPLTLVMVGIATWMAGMFLLGVWAIYRIARGWMRLNARQAMPARLRLHGRPAGPRPGANGVLRLECAPAPWLPVIAARSIPTHRSPRAYPTGAPALGDSRQRKRPSTGPLSHMQFTDLGLAEPLLRAVQEQGYDTPTPIQAQAIPQVLKGGDLLAGAQTGTGKTAGFVLPMLQRLMASPPSATCAAASSSAR
jgi:hypothetical protein